MRHQLIKISCLYMTKLKITFILLGKLGKMTEVHRVT